MSESHNVAMNLGTVYSLSSQGYVIRKPLFRDDITKLIKLQQGVIPVYKKGDMLYELGATNHPFHTSPSIFSPPTLR